MYVCLCTYVLCSFLHPALTNSWKVQFWQQYALFNNVDSKDVKIQTNYHIIQRVQHGQIKRKMCLHTPIICQGQPVKISCGDILPPAHLLSSCCSWWQQPKATDWSPAIANLYELGIWSSNPLCNLCCDRAFNDGIQHIFVAALDIKLNGGESREVTTLHGTGLLHTTPVKVVLVDVNLTSIKTMVIQLSMIAIEKIQTTTVPSLRHTPATQRAQQRPQKPSWR